MNLPLDTLLYPKRWDYITDFVQEMEIEFFAKRMHHSKLLTLKMNELFIRLSRSLHEESTATVNSSTSESLRKLRGKILLSLNHPWTVAEMASEVSLSESRFYSVYRSFYGTCFIPFTSSFFSGVQNGIPQAAPPQEAAQLPAESS